MTRLWLIAALALALAVVIVALTGDDDRPRDGSAARGAGSGEALRFDKSGLKTDFAKHSVPLSEFQSGGPPRDGIPPVDEPRPTTQADAERWLSGREPY